jgi:group I intron endonuclease
MTTGIYHIVNTTNGHEYVGRAYDVERRMRGHLKDLRAGVHHSQYLQHAYNKHGEDHFRFEVLLTCPRERCVQYEQWCIDWRKPAYNMVRTAAGGSEPCHSEEVKANHSAAMNRPEVKASHSTALKKRYEDPAAHEVNSKAQRKRYEDPAERRNSSVAQKTFWSRLNADPAARKAYLLKRRETRARNAAARRLTWEDGDLQVVPADEVDPKS